MINIQNQQKMNDKVGIYKRCLTNLQKFSKSQIQTQENQSLNDDDDWQLIKVQGNNKFGQLSIDPDNQEFIFQINELQVPFKVSKISLGCEHSVILTQNGQLFSCGNNQYGQLGVGIIISKTYGFTQIQSINKFIDIVVGHNHNLALQDNQQVVNVWGSNSRGQLGVSFSQAVYDIQEIKIDNPNPIQSIDAGKHNSGLIVNNQLYLFGDNSYGQIINEQMNVLLPLKQNFDNNLKIKKFKCGHYQTLIIDQNNSIFQIRKKRLEQIKFYGKQIMKINSQQFNSILTKDGDIYIQGNIEGVDIKQLSKIQNIYSHFQNLDFVIDMDIKDNYWVIQTKKQIQTWNQNKNIQQFNTKLGHIKAGHQFFISYKQQQYTKKEIIQTQFELYQNNKKQRYLYEKKYKLPIQSNDYTTINNSRLKQKSLIQDSINFQENKKYTITKSYQDNQEFNKSINDLDQDLKEQSTLRQYSEYSFKNNQFQSPVNTNIKMNNSNYHIDKRDNSNQKVKIIENNKMMNDKILLDKQTDLEQYINNLKGQNRLLNQKIKNIENQYQSEQVEQQKIYDQQILQMKAQINQFEKEIKRLKQNNGQILQNYESQLEIQKKGENNWYQGVLELKKEYEVQCDYNSKLEKKVFDLEKQQNYFKDKYLQVEQQFIQKNIKLQNCLNLIKEIESRYSEQESIEKIFLNTKISYNEDFQNFTNTSNNMVPKFNDDSHLKQQKIGSQKINYRNFQQQQNSNEIDSKNNETNILFRTNILDSNI